MQAVTLPARRSHTYRRAQRLGALGLAPVIALLISGCDVRRETPANAELVPNSVELVRRAAADNAVQLTDFGQAWLAAGVNETEQAEMQRLVADSNAHLASLGGVYVSGLAPNDADVVDESASSPVVVGSWAPLISTLNQAAAQNFLAANADPDGNKARLLASIGTSQALTAQRLANLAGMADYDPVSELILAGWDGGMHDGIVDDVADLGEPTGGEATGITVADFQAIVKSEDAARYAFEVAAARNEGDLRTALRQRARIHGDRGQAWAVLGQIAETDQDPRLVAYSIPAELTPAELVLFVEKELTLRWASLIAAAAPDARGPLIEALLASQLTVAQWGGGIATFPGMPDIGDQFGGSPLQPDQPRIPYEWAAELEEIPDGGPTGD